MRMRTPFLLLLAALVAACPRAPARPNVLVLAVDTLRADRLGCQGNPRGLTPNLDRLAGGGVRFARAHAHAPWTLPSFATILSGELPPQHGAGGYADHYTGLRSEITTWPECFERAGYDTAAVVNVDFLSTPFGLTQGFATLDERFTLDNARARDAHATTEAALDFLRRPRASPFLLFVHYFDPHAEYRPPQPWRERFADPRDAHEPNLVFGSREQVVAWRTGQSAAAPEDVARAEKLYDGEVAYVDDEIGRLCAALRTLPGGENTLIVLVADHGEEFLEHGSVEHGHSLHEELLHVPLLLSWPGHLEPRVEERPVGLVALARTLCRLCGVDPDPGFAELDLFEEPRGRDADAAGFSYGNFWGAPWEALRSGDRAWMRIPQSAGASLVRFYDTSADPREQHDLSAERSAEAAGFAERVEALRQRARTEGWRAGPPARLSEETLQRLRDTGYAGEHAEGRPR